MALWDIRTKVPGMPVCDLATVFVDVCSWQQQHTKLVEGEATQADLKSIEPEYIRHTLAPYQLHTVGWIERSEIERSVTAA